MKNDYTQPSGFREEDANYLKNENPPTKKIEESNADSVDMLDRMDITMSEDNREGDEMSGDDHSMGLQGEEEELKSNPHIDSGIPGEEGAVDSLAGLND